jgi:hypothetical protein
MTKIPKLDNDEMNRIARGLFDKTIKGYITEQDMKDLFLFLHNPRDGIMTWPDEELEQIGGIVAEVKDMMANSWMPKKIRIVHKDDWKIIGEKYKALETVSKKAMDDPAFLKDLVAREALEEG